jgi:hypothetical protein
MPSLAISTPVALLRTPEGGQRLPLVTLEWHRARLALLYPQGHDVVELQVEGLPIDQARCDVAKTCREMGLKYLFFLDWDVLPPPETLQRLVYTLDNRPEIDVAAALYTTRAPVPAPLVYRAFDVGVDWDWTAGDVLDVEGVATGATLFRVSCFDKVPEPWFVTDGGTEDLYFCRHLRENGGRIVLDTALQCGHQDQASGITYTVPQDSLPWRRWREKHGVS